MRQSQLFVKTSKTFPRDETSINAQLLIKAGFIDKLMAGVYTLLPMGFLVYKKIEQIIREEMNKVGAQEIFMPTLQPKENWQQSCRYDEMDVLFSTKLKNGQEILLGPTHEEILVPLAKKYVGSYKDLPFASYHIQNKFRNEKRAKSGILRGREFMMKDLYSFHASQEDLDEYYKTISDVYEKIFSRVGIGEVTYKTYASGGTFSKYSHEFQTITPAGEDIIYICNNCHVAVNKEIIEEQGNKCPECSSSDLLEEKAVEVGNIFKLATKFSRPFKLNFRDQNDQEQPVIMGCYGIGLQRLMGTIVEVKNDERGMLWPESVAPFKLHLIAIKESKATDEIYVNLQKKGIEVFYDDREDISVGEKFADADLIGCPYRVVVSEKTLKQKSVELKKRASAELEIIKIADLSKKLLA